MTTVNFALHCIGVRIGHNQALIIGTREYRRAGVTPADRIDTASMEIQRMIEDESAGDGR